MSSVEWRVAPCGREAATWAVERWHYSQFMPSGKLVCYGLWEAGEFQGAAVYGRGPSPWVAGTYGLRQTEMCELVRVALRAHSTPVTAVVARSLRLLRDSNPGFRLVVSFADPAQGHLGRIYQAGNWLYVGRSAEVIEYQYKGRWRHARGIAGVDRPSDLSAERRRLLPTRRRPGKYRYVYPLDRSMRRQLRDRSEPYPTQLDS